jgi:hypothetical protein
MSEARATVFHCPYCAEEDLRPAEAWLDESPGAWACMACRRVFTVRLLGPVDRPVQPEDGPAVAGRMTQEAAS